MKRLMLMFSLVGLAAVVPLGSSSQEAAADLAKPAARVRKDAEKRRMAEAFGRLPLSFEANEGQTDRRVKFISRGQGYALFVTPDEMVLSLSKAEQQAGTADPLRRPRQSKKSIHDVLRIKLAGGNSNALVTGVEELAGRSNYFIGSDRTKWRTNVPNYGKVRVQDVYPGIDLVYYGNHQQLEEDFVVAAGADPAAIAMKISGASKVSVASGELVLAAAGGELRLRKPTIYQEMADGRREVSGTYALRGTQEVTFKVGDYDRTRPLIIDPVLVYSTYLGGSTGGYGAGIAVDSAGNAYVAGSTQAADFPVKNAIQPTFASTEEGLNATVTEINAGGTALVYSTYVGGSNSDSAYGIAVDSAGNAYVTGSAQSSNFPGTSTSPIQPALAGLFPNAFVTEISAGGTALVYSTYLGGGNNSTAVPPSPYASTTGYGIAVDSAGNAYVTGSTDATNFPTKNAIQPNNNTTLTGTCGCFEGPTAFVTEINAGGRALVYSTYLGGSGYDQGNAIAVDSGGNAYVAGSAQSPNFPGASASPIQPTLRGVSNAFVTEIKSGGTALVYSTYLGGTANDGGYGIAVDSTGNAYVTGYTSSINFPTKNPIQPALAGTLNAFVTEINAGGTALVYSTYLGGGGDQGYGIAVDSAGNVYVTGATQSTTFPTMNAIQPANAAAVGQDNAFVTEINAGGAALVYSTYLGGSYNDQGYGIATDCSGNAYVTGLSQSSDFPGASSSPIQPTQNTAYPETHTGFVAKIGQTSATQVANGVTFTASAGQIGVCAVPLASLPTMGEPPGLTFPYGFFNWTVTGLSPGETVTVMITFPGSLPASAQYWKVIGGVWTNATSLFSSNGTSVATLTITDGGFGDEDGIVNGEITDPGGVGIPPPQVAVPNLVGLTQTAAVTAITGADLVVGVVTTAPSSTMPSGSVISETPTAGTEVNVGSAVNLVVSSGGPASITATAGTPQSATADTPFATAMAATVVNGAGSPVPGVSVTFTAPASGASGTFANGTALYTTSTNTSGVATATTFTANGTAGSYTVTAAASGVTTVANFSLTNTAEKTHRTRTTLTTSGSPSLINQRATFTATVTSTHGPIPGGETVTFYDCAEKADHWGRGGDLSVFVDDDQLRRHNCHEIGTGTTASGVARLETSSLSAGDHIIVARYPGDATFDPSSGRVRQEVLLHPPKTLGR